MTHATAVDAQQPQDDGKACKMHNKLVSARDKTSFYNVYLGFLPLQVAIIFALIVQKMFTEEYTVESCKSFMDIFNDTTRRPYYDCTYKAEAETSEKVADHCNKNASAENFEIFNIDCTQYYFEVSQVFEGIVIGYSAHLLLSKIIIYFIRFLHFLTLQVKSEAAGCSCARVACILIFIIIIVIPSLLWVIVVGALVLRQINETIRVFLNRQFHSDRQRNLVIYTILLIGPSLTIALYTMIRQKRFAVNHKSCLINVSYELSSRSPSNTNDTQDGQPSSSYFDCCKSSTQDGQPGPFCFGRCMSSTHGQSLFRFCCCCKPSTQNERSSLMHDMNNLNNINGASST